MDQPFIFELHEGLPRQGPGSDACNEKAFSLIPDLPGDSRILDIGCGSGMCPPAAGIQESPDRIFIVPVPSGSWWRIRAERLF